MSDVELDLGSMMRIDEGTVTDIILERMLEAYRSESSLDKIVSYLKELGVHPDSEKVAVASDLRLKFFPPLVVGFHINDYVGVINERLALRERLHIRADPYAYMTESLTLGDIALSYHPAEWYFVNFSLTAVFSCRRLFILSNEDFLSELGAFEREL